MNAQRLAVLLTVANLAVLAGVVSRDFVVEAQTVPAVLRAQKIELVEPTGEIRGSLEIAGDREAVLRLRDSSGAIRVKIGASADGSGLILYDESTAPGVQAVARRRATPARSTTTSVKLFGPGSRERVITP